MVDMDNETIDRMVNLLNAMTDETRTLRDRVKELENENATLRRRLMGQEIAELLENDDVIPAIV